MSKCYTLSSCVKYYPELRVEKYFFFWLGFPDLFVVAVAGINLANLYSSSGKCVKKEKKRGRWEEKEENGFCIFLPFYVRGILQAVILPEWSQLSSKGVLMSKHENDWETMILFAQLLHLLFKCVLCPQKYLAISYCFA